ncbi:hypothetical protein [Microvirga sp. M2]|uniref:hypothetical protein n=1 Tax=Microvirga sp. M2 TaxID=3073270 RepID=UPI0039C3273A
MVKRWIVAAGTLAAILTGCQDPAPPAPTFGQGGRDAVYDVPATRTFQIKVGLTDPPPAMRLGATAVGRILTLVFLTALYVAWSLIKRLPEDGRMPQP